MALRRGRLRRCFVWRITFSLCRRSVQHRRPHGPPAFGSRSYWPRHRRRNGRRPAFNRSRIDLLGQASADFQSRTRELAEKVTDRAADLADGVTAAVANEAQVQGLTAKSLKQSASDASRKVQNIAPVDGAIARRHLNAPKEGRPGRVFAHLTLVQRNMLAANVPSFAVTILSLQSRNCGGL